jgi:hypothetical protein
MFLSLVVNMISRSFPDVERVSTSWLADRLTGSACSGSTAHLLILDTRHQVWFSAWPARNIMDYEPGIGAAPNERIPRNFGLSGWVRCWSLNTPLPNLLFHLHTVSRCAKFVFLHAFFYRNSLFKIASVADPNSNPKES